MRTYPDILKAYPKEVVELAAQSRERWEDYLKEQDDQMKHMSRGQRDHTRRRLNIDRRVVRDHLRRASKIEISPNAKRVKLRTGAILFPDHQVIRMKKKLLWLHDLKPEQMALLSNEDVDLIFKSLMNQEAKWS